MGIYTLVDMYTMKHLIIVLVDEGHMLWTLNKFRLSALPRLIQQLRTQGGVKAVVAQGSMFLQMFDLAFHCHITEFDDLSSIGLHGEAALHNAVVLPVEGKHELSLCGRVNYDHGGVGLV